MRRALTGFHRMLIGVQVSPPSEIVLAKCRQQAFEHQRCKNGDYDHQNQHFVSP
jgi:hypothetical protein